MEVVTADTAVRIVIIVITAIMAIAVRIAITVIAVIDVFMAITAVICNGLNSQYTYVYIYTYESVAATDSVRLLTSAFWRLARLLVPSSGYHEAATCHIQECS